MSLAEKVEKLFGSPHIFVIKSGIRRIEGEWYVKLSWYHIQEPGGNTIKSSKSPGFDTNEFEKCVDDALAYLDSLL